MLGQVTGDSWPCHPAPSVIWLKKVGGASWVTSFWSHCFHVHCGVPQKTPVGVTSVPFPLRLLPAPHEGMNHLGFRALPQGILTPVSAQCSQLPMSPCPFIICSPGNCDLEFGGHGLTTPMCGSTASSGFVILRDNQILPSTAYWDKLVPAGCPAFPLCPLFSLCPLSSCLLLADFPISGFCCRD